MAESDTRGLGNRMRVLLVDDEPDVRVLLRLCIQDRCEKVEAIEEARNGAEAVEKARTLRPDVVVMDLKMPVMDGLEATRRIKEALAGTDVVVYSVVPEHLHEVKDAGATDQFLKGDIEGLLGYLCPQ